MTDSLSFSPRLLPVVPLHPTRRNPTLLPARRFPDSSSPSSHPSPLLPKEDRVSQGLLAVLLIATLPTVAYSLMQAWHLASGDTLAQAVRTLVP